MKRYPFFLAIAALGAALFCTGTPAAAETTSDIPAVATAVTAVDTQEDTTSAEDTADCFDCWVTAETGERYYYNAQGEMLKDTIAEIDGTSYLFAPDGSQRVGWQTVNGLRQYYNPSTGQLETGWIHFGGAYYYSSPESGKLTETQYGLETIQGEDTDNDTIFLLDSFGALHLGFGTDDYGNRYYVTDSGALAVGNLEIDGIWYRFWEDGSQEVGFTEINDKEYYFDYETGESKLGLCNIWGSYYYITPEDGMQYGWQTVDGKTYYFDPDTGVALSGIQTIEGSTYYFYEDGKMLQSDSIHTDGITYRANASGVITCDKTMITGTSEATVAQMQAYLKSVNPNVAQSVLDMIPYYISEGEAEGIRGDIALAQSCLETGNFTFTGSAVTLSQNNFCGLGVTSNGMTGNSFATPQIGIRAQIQHLKAYANTEALTQDCVDARFRYVTRGCAPYVEWLGIPDNPYGKGWAGQQGYGTRILRVLAAILSF